MRDFRSAYRYLPQSRIGNRKLPMPPGFTLIELLVVLVIISVVVAFVGPRLAGSISNTNLKTVAKRIAASLRYARSQAVSESRAYETLFDLDKHRMVIQRVRTVQEDEGDVKKDKEGDDTDHFRAKRYQLPDDVRFEKAIWRDVEGDSGLFRITFVANGGSSGGELLLRNERGHRYRISVDMITGTVRVGEVNT